MQIQKKLRILLLITGSLVMVTLAWAGKKNISAWLGSPNQTKQSEKEKYDPVQAALLDELSNLLTRFDSSNYTYALEGSLTVIDRKDSANAMENLPYKFYKDGARFYYRLGRTETISTDQLCLYVDHDAKRILITPAKTILQPAVMPFKELYNHVKEEGFNLSKSIGSASALISVKNETHMSCKELSISYDTATKNIHRIFMRLPDIIDNLDSKKETWITLVIKRWEEDPDPRSFIQQNQFIKKDEHGNWIPVPAYADFDVVTN